VTRTASRPATATLCLALLLSTASAPWTAAAVHAQTAAPPAAPLNLPSLGDEASEDFGIGTERRLGDRIMREIRRDPVYLDDPVLLEYLASLWLPLLDAARRKGEITAELDPRFAWEMFLVRDRSVNAFALPGGYIGVHLGLVALTQSRDELASVLAHELSHVTQRHIARGFANSRRQSLIALAGMILGVLAASRANSADGMNAAIVGSQAASVQGELNFSRELEREADRVGFSVLTQAGFSPAGMAAMFERLEAASRLNDSGGFPYLRTHPLTTERIGEARARVGLSARSLPSAGHPAATAQALAPAMSADHALAVARARVLADPRDEALRRWQRTDVAGLAPIERLSASASSALASALLDDPSRADAALQQARSALAALAAAGGGARPTREGTALSTAQRSLALLAAQVAMARGDGTAALAALAPHADNGNRVMLMLSAEAALLQAGGRASGLLGIGPPGRGAAPAVPPVAAPDAAASPTGDAALATVRQRAEALQIWLASHPGDAIAWQLSSQLWARLGLPLRSLRADAEARYALGDLTGASDRLRAGQLAARRGTGLDNDAIESTVIDARLREIDAQRRQIFLEERGGRAGP
jgi:beta-barrel assembly-enhancing protease